MQLICHCSTESLYVSGLGEGNADCFLGIQSTSPARLRKNPNLHPEDSSCGISIALSVGIYQPGPSFTILFHLLVHQQNQKKGTENLVVNVLTAAHRKQLNFLSLCCNFLIPSKFAAAQTIGHIMGSRKDVTSCRETGIAQRLLRPLVLFPEQNSGNSITHLVV